MDDRNPASAEAELSRARRAAKRLKTAVAAGDAGLAAVFDRRRPPAATHAEGLHVIAGEEGAKSRPQLKFAAEAAAMTRDDRRSALCRALFQCAFHGVDRLLALDPALPEGRLPLLLALVLEDAALALLARDPALALQRQRTSKPDFAAQAPIPMADPRACVDLAVALSPDADLRGIDLAQRRAA
jgi:hypothetical protein